MFKIVVSNSNKKRLCFIRFDKGKSFFLCNYRPNALYRVLFSKCQGAGHDPLYHAPTTRNPRTALDIVMLTIVFYWI